MGTITARRRKDGSTAYLAQISIMRDGEIAFRQSKTFDRKAIAEAWLKRREGELAKPGGMSKAAAPRASATLREAIERYVLDSEKAIGRTKSQVLKTIKSHDIADLRCSEIVSRDIVDLARTLRAKASPATVSNYLSHLGAVFSIARAAWGFDLDPQAMTDAAKVTRKLGLTSKSRERSRRPTLDELDKLLNHFGEVRRRRPDSAPMQAIIGFAIFSTRRLEEITRIKWEDLDEEGSRIVVRDMKNPGEKIGNDVRCDLPPEALRIIKAQPRTAKEIFPYSTDAIGAAFTRACKLLAIVDLHFHDLRHDGVSRLFELGWNIPHVAAVSGHRSWTSLRRYTHLRQTGDKFAGWRWLEIAAPPLAEKQNGPDT
jgi:integrase